MLLGNYGFKSVEMTNAYIRTALRMRVNMEAERRLQVLSLIIRNSTYWCRGYRGSTIGTGVKAHYSAATQKSSTRAYYSGTKVTIGDVSKEVKKTPHPELVPQKYLPDSVPQSTLKALRWMLQKDVLGQDIFLLGRPGPLRRTLAMQYLQLTGREVEYVSLSRDTTESDLKQRREIISGTSHYIDQSAVRAALEGRVLVLEGIEKAERNVLPVLNNLLENREMQLEDGRFLIPVHRYDKLLQEHSQEELDAWKLVRVSEDFRIIAIGLPVPRYIGNPLDPPLRSRFQARDVNPLPFKEQLETLYAIGVNVSSDRVSKMLSYAHTLLSQESTALGLPDFPIENLAAVVNILNLFPSLKEHEALFRLYPYDVFLAKEGQTAVEDTLKTFELFPMKGSVKDTMNLQTVKHTDQGTHLQIFCHGASFEAVVPASPFVSHTESPQGLADFVATPYHDTLIAALLQSHTSKDFCLIGPRGCGKSVVVRHLANILGYQVEPVMLYQDMTARDLLQQRTTLPNGDTVWYNSPLVNAALDGKLAVLDGIHRIHHGTLAVLHRLVHDRELQLYDGTRLLRHDRYDEIKSEYSLSDVDMAKSGVYRIHPSFRIIALAEPPIIGGSKGQWLTSELLSLFLYHSMRPISIAEELNIIKTLCGNPSEKMSSIVKLTHQLRSSEDPTLKSLAGSLSTRQLLRIARRLSKFPEESPYHTVHKACLARFLPSLAYQALDKTMAEAGITQPEVKPEGEAGDLLCEVRDGILKIGKTTASVYNPATKTKVPDVLFYDIAQHISILEGLLQDFLLGEHLLLVGNQGVGKNKLVDRLLHLLNRPREYLQLHRDTTVQTLTLQPTVRDGVIVYEDSPLVRAVKLGHVLIVDEADKAPTHVTCILKSLVESGEMVLSDGRRIIPSVDTSATVHADNIISMHPDFRMLVLANRPGFPFLGNDFFGALGDLFSCHAVDNPSLESEMALLSQYGPKVPRDILLKLVRAFGELRSMADKGLISYPYSTREVVNIVRHLEQFPEEGLASVVRNVFDFDAYSQETQDTLMKTLNKHGIPVGAKPTNVNLGKELFLPPALHCGEWHITQQVGGKRAETVQLIVEERELKHKGPFKLNRLLHPLDYTEARSVGFSELQSYWTIPIHETNIICDVVVNKNLNADPLQDVVHVLTANPVSLYSMIPSGNTMHCLPLHEFFTVNRASYPFSSASQRRFRMAPLGGILQGCVAVHEEVSNQLLLIDPQAGEVSQIELSSLLNLAAEKITRTLKQKAKMAEFFRMLDTHSESNLLVFYQPGGSKIDVVNIEHLISYLLTTPLKLDSLQLVSLDKWLLVDRERRSKFLLKKTSSDDPIPSDLHPIIETDDSSNAAVGSIITSTKEDLSNFVLGSALKQEISSPNRLMVSKDSYATIVVGFPELELSANEVHVWPREVENTSAPQYNQTIGAKVPVQHNEAKTVVIQKDSGQIVQGLPTWKVPIEVLPDGKKPPGVTAYLEVTDLVHHKLRYIPVPEPYSASMFTSWQSNVSESSLVMAATSNEGLVTVDAGGCIRLWETGIASLERSLQKWRRMIGQDNNSVQLTIDKPSGKAVTKPKVGKFDPTGRPHVGGGMWAGGTGGRDTAGLGGKGGPYRLDAGHDVYQVEQVEKDAVPEHIKQAAREMAKKAFKERLREIQMSEYDAELYEEFASGVRKQVQSLRVILNSLQAKAKERQWLRHQTSGELDDMKLIEGLTGEKSIYRRRAEKEPEMGSPQQKPKHLKLVVDLSGSMYRFNGYDGRLDRVMEAAVLVMEAFENYEQKFKYDIVGHSGDNYDSEIVKSDKPPKNNKERLNVLKTMHAHSQFCMAGDNTLEATSHAIRSLAAEECDEAFVIVLSDANLERYGIPPEHLARILVSEPKVNAYAIFIGSLGDQAARLTKRLPSGRGFVCLDLKNIPQILQQIFTATMLAT